MWGCGRTSDAKAMESLVLRYCCPARMCQAESCGNAQAVSAASTLPLMSGPAGTALALPLLTNCVARLGTSPVQQQTHNNCLHVQQGGE